MKTITKKSLDELAKEMPVLKETEMCQLIGGDKYVFDEKGIVIDIIEDPHNYFVVMKGGEEVSIGIGNDFKATCHVGATGANFEGTAINRDVFEFMAKNTNVEWGLCTYGTSKPGGYLATSCKENTVEIDTDRVKEEGYTNLYHNHGNGVDPNKSREFKEIFNNPSETDLKTADELEQGGFKEFYVYNEIYEDYNYYNSKSKSMEQDAKEKGYDIKKK